MIKYIIIGAWTCALTLGSAYGAVSWKAGQSPKPEEEKFFGGLDYVKTNVISVPMIGNGRIQGYVIAQFVFTVEAALLKKLSVPPEAFLVDEAFKTIYASHAINFQELKKQDLPALSKTLKTNVNKRFGAEMVESVLIESINYIPKAMARSRGAQSQLGR